NINTAGLLVLLRIFFSDGSDHKNDLRSLVLTSVVLYFCGMIKRFALLRTIDCSLASLKKRCWAINEQLPAINKSVRVNLYNCVMSDIFDTSQMYCFFYQSTIHAISIWRLSCWACRQTGN